MSNSSLFQRFIFLAAATIAAGALAQTRLDGAGATFPAPIYKQWISDYHASHPEVEIDYQAKGSGAGITGITDRTIDFAGSDAPMSPGELAKAGGDIIEIPSVAGGVAIAFNLPGFTGDLKLTGPIVADIFLGNITAWNDPKIAAINPGVTLPGTAITPIVRGDKSGTTFVFTSYLATQSSDAKDVIGVDKSGNWPGGQKGEKSDGVTHLLQTVAGGVGYIEENYAAQNHLPVALIQNKAGKFVGPTSKAVSAAASAAADHMIGDQLEASIWNQDGDDTYPISSFTYFLVHKDLSYLKDPARAKSLADFLTWASTDGQAKAAALNYAPVGDAVSAKVAKAIASLNGK